MTTMLGKRITKNSMMGTEQPAQILLPTTVIGESVSTVNILRTETANRTDPTIQPSIAHIKQANKLGHSDWNYPPFRIRKSGNKMSVDFGPNVDE